jgi:hypothetical protein
MRTNPFSTAQGVWSTTFQAGATIVRRYDVSDEATKEQA